MKMIRFKVTSHVRQLMSVSVIFFTVSHVGGMLPMHVKCYKCYSALMSNEHKATGPDGIPNKILIETAQQIAPSLCLLFNLSLRRGSLPDEWKTSNIVPVFKKGKPSHVENYRPISLLSNISKVHERCILVKMRNHLLQYISENQHGFVPGRSCTVLFKSWSVLVNSSIRENRRT